jgi:hypothetical protein
VVAVIVKVWLLVAVEEVVVVGVDVLVIVEDSEGLDDILVEAVEVSVRVCVLVADVVEDGEPVELNDEFEVKVGLIIDKSILVGVAEDIEDND